MTTDGVPADGPGASTPVPRASGRFDLLSVGDTAIDSFIELLPGTAQLVEDRRGRHLLAMEFGAKLPFGSVEIVEGGGNAASSAVACSRLGLSTGLVSNVGDDRAGQDIIASLTGEHVDGRFIRTNPSGATNFHFVLRYGAERTILTRHEEYEYRWPDLAPEEVPGWLYLSSVAAHATAYHDLIADWLDAHPRVRLGFEPGTFELWIGPQRLRRIYRRAEVLILNRDEAVIVSHGSRDDVAGLLDRLHALGPRVVVMTDGPEGAYASSPEGRFHVPIYPDPAPPVDRTGAGDAFAATFMTALVRGRPAAEGLRWAAVNAMSVIQHVGSHKGLLDQAGLRHWLDVAPPSYGVRPLAGSLEAAVRA